MAKKSKKVIKVGTININELALNQRKFDTKEIGRGIGIHKPRKGKGSFTRKQKHRKGFESND